MYKIEQTYLPLISLIFSKVIKERLVVKVLPSADLPSGINALANDLAIRMSNYRSGRTLFGQRMLMDIKDVLGTEPEMFSINAGVDLMAERALSHDSKVEEGVQEMWTAGGCRDGGGKRLRCNQIVLHLIAVI